MSFIRFEDVDGEVTLINPEHIIAVEFAKHHHLVLAQIVTVDGHQMRAVIDRENRVPQTEGPGLFETHCYNNTVNI